MRVLISMAVLISTAYGADFTTYIGTGVQNPYNQSTIGAIAADSEGDTYVTGSNAFVTKLDPTGNPLFTKTFGAGANYSYGLSIAVDPAGNVWVGGQTVAADLSLMSAIQSSAGSSGTGFLVKMSPGGTLLYSSYFGGTLGSSSVTGVATDQSGNVYVTGWTDASDFPITAGLPAAPVNPKMPSYGMFVAKLDSAGQKIAYSTAITGSACIDCFDDVPKVVGSGIAVDGSGNALIAGTTNTILPALPGGSSGSGAFVFKIDAAGDAVDYFNYLGASVNATIPGSITFGGRPITADAAGNAYLAGYTTSPDLPGIYPTVYDRGNNPFAMKLNPSGATLWARFLSAQSSPNTPTAAAIAVDSSGNSWFTGTDGSTFGPVFVTAFSADGSAVQYFAHFPQGEAGQDIAVDPSGVVHSAGSIGLVSTISPPLYLGDRAVSIVNAASGQFSGTIAPGEIISIYGTGLGPNTPAGAVPQDGLFPISLAGVQVLVNGAPIPLLYVSASQINAEIPSPLSPDANGLATLQVVDNSVALPVFRLGVVPSFFGAFENAASLAVINQDGTLNSPTHPAKPGSYISIYATGFGRVSLLTMDGAVAAAANNYCPTCQITFITYSYDVPETVRYFGLSPGLIDGLTQINVQITPDAPGTLQVWFTPRESSLAQQLLGFVQVAR